MRSRIRCSSIPFGILFPLMTVCSFPRTGFPVTSPGDHRVGSPSPRRPPTQTSCDGWRVGEIGALGELYDRHHEPVRRFVARATSNAEDVDDLVQAAFLAPPGAPSRYDGRPSCRPWLVGIAAQLLRGRRRSVGHLFAVLSSLRGVRAATTDPRPALQARADVEQALGCISEAKRITLLLAEV
jgi:hypothetical protein